jgi:hypothetical protein
MESSSTLYRSYALVVIAMFSFIVVLFAAFLNPPAKINDADVKLPGSLNTYVIWDDGSIDVDLWMRDPYGEWVGFMRKQGAVLDLLRDDLGTANDSPENFENIFSRTLPAGEYVVNLVCWECTAPPVNAQIEIAIQPPGQARYVFFRDKIVLTKDNEEMTVIRFRIDGKGELVKGSPSREPELLPKSFK